MWSRVRLQDVLASLKALDTEIFYGPVRFSGSGSNEAKEIVLTQVIDEVIQVRPGSIHVFAAGGGLTWWWARWCTPLSTNRRTSSTRCRRRRRGRQPPRCRS